MTRKGILGKKVGMTQVFTENGELIPVTVVETTPNVVLQVKTVENDGYDAVQLGYDDKRDVLSNKPAKGHAAKANTTPKRFIREIKDVELGDYKVSDEIKADIFESGDYVDVTGTTKGHGYQGNVHKDGQSRGPETHGSRYHRRPGSLGAIINRVFPGKKLPGRMGNKTITILNLQIVKADTENNVLLIKGNVPGANKSFVEIKSAVRAPKK
ncbi:50S ribosomal protein L3 [Secundilactobacillus paracollinoides]|uniref:Large ribosomal subunit protein uL3 n=1 Tax=Secundilactobacillus paracollinoides TaxID=240427 RepID=A0A1B2IZA6_9LACO|nr:50S ribosomal protein L3 [Secundilactobacillus paracollinoides]ANZ61462.1 50S ribosomal protein L3 [Secundilactobacillus paracollinoides]ANZ64148.1 50S ribosomal protein L3 [Secundilactobacillus paracollinoides]ANZ67383.1 50S ribosomal protein L3 [Secundilactobacillus paracollinoides]KRL77444.1 50S ribosomal protein L3 [Secundilactobacillus paracollinoides DSM 15502 = JCM 11969]